MGNLPVGPASLQVRQSPYGNYLTDGQGRSLYIYTKDTPDTSVCYGQCQSLWPPLTGSILGNGIGSTTRSDGTQQVTFNKWPLYYYAGDNGQSMSLKGQTVDAMWYLISPSGQPIVTPLIPANQVSKTELVSQPVPEDLPATKNYQQYWNWKSNLDYDNFLPYYRFRQWRKYAANRSDWQNRAAFNRWRNRYYGGDVTIQYFQNWRNRWSDSDYDDWRSWKKW